MRLRSLSMPNVAYWRIRENLTGVVQLGYCFTPVCSALGSPIFEHSQKARGWTQLKAWARAFRPRPRPVLSLPTFTPLSEVSSEEILAQKVGGV